MLGLLSIGGDWDDRAYGLNDAGRATALEALRSRATRTPVDSLGVELGPALVVRNHAAFTGRKLSYAAPTITGC